jgi:HD-GYP domain-containing protein (c-di-GMP phosphodiesterase class II)
MGNIAPVDNDKLIDRYSKYDRFNERGVLVVSTLSILDNEEIQMTGSQGIERVEDDVVQSLNVTNANAASYIQHNKLIDSSVLEIKEIFQEIRVTKKIPLLDIRNKIVPLIKQTIELPRLFGLFASLQSKDDYTYRHNIGVGVIASLIGKWLNLKESELIQLSIAATLHDVGKVKIPLDILNKPDKLTAEEFDFMKKHTIFGYEMLKETVGINRREALVALQHHERQDGSGYPFGISSDKLDLFGRIVAVADVFHAMTSKRPYRNASPFYETLKQMNQNAFGELDARIIQLFINKVTQALIGNEILLTDGRMGAIIMINPHEPLRPLVRTKEGAFLDLSKEPAIHIEQVFAN